MLDTPDHLWRYLYFHRDRRELYTYIDDVVRGMNNTMDAAGQLVFNSIIVV